jgi:hypothetical protein
VNWAFAIHNYVWWLGIGHAGTLISALEAQWDAGKLFGAGRARNPSAHDLSGALERHRGRRRRHMSNVEAAHPILPPDQTYADNVMENCTYCTQRIQARRSRQGAPRAPP